MPSLCTLQSTISMFAKVISRSENAALTYFSASEPSLGLHHWQERDQGLWWGEQSLLFHSCLSWPLFRKRGGSCNSLQSVTLVLSYYFLCCLFLFFPPHFTNLLLVSACTHFPHHPILRTRLIEVNFLLEKHSSVNVGIILFLPEQQSSLVRNLWLVLQLFP